jgi:ribosomal protein L16/L10AE
MKQYPARTKFKKYHKANFSYSSILEHKSFLPVFGLSGIQALESGTMTYKQIEACRRALRRGLKKTGIFEFVYLHQSL